MRKDKDKGIYNDGGLTSRAIQSDIIKSMTISSWAHSYHKPYKLDWGEATGMGRIRIKERFWEN